MFPIILMFLRFLILFFSVYEFLENRDIFRLDHFETWKKFRVFQALDPQRFPRPERSRCLQRAGSTTWDPTWGRIEKQGRDVTSIHPSTHPHNYLHGKYSYPHVIDEPKEIQKLDCFHTSLKWEIQHFSSGGALMIPPSMPFPYALSPWRAK